MAGVDSVPTSPYHPGEPFLLSVPCVPFIVFISFCHCCAVVVFVASVDKISCCLLCSHNRGLWGGGKLRTFGCLPWPPACLDLESVVSCLSHICLSYLALDAASEDRGDRVWDLLSGPWNLRRQLIFHLSSGVMFTLGYTVQRC